MKILMAGKRNMKDTNLLKILTSKLKYSKPEVEIIEMNKADIITSSADTSMQMAKYSPEELTKKSKEKQEKD